MAKRVKSDKPAIIEIIDWQEADKYLQTIGDLQLKINQAEHTAKDIIDEAKAELAEQVTPLQEQMNRFTRSLEAFAVNHMEDFKSARSRKLSFGSLGWRKSTSISVKKNTLELIKKIFSGQKANSLVRIKETVDKEALAKLTDEQLTSVKARRVVKDDFFVEPDLPKAVDYS